VRLAGGQKTQHSRFILSEKIAAPVERSRVFSRDPRGPLFCKDNSRLSTLDYRLSTTDYIWRPYALGR
jgi:hypothetical protein